MCQRKPPVWGKEEAAAVPSRQPHGIPLPQMDAAEYHKNLPDSKPLPGLRLSHEGSGPATGAKGRLPP